MKKFILVVFSFFILQGCERPNQLVLGFLAAGSVIALQQSLADDCRPGREISLSDGSSTWDNGTC